MQRPNSLPLASVLQIDISTFTAREQSRLVLRNDGDEAKASVVLCERNSLLEHAALLEVRSRTRCAWVQRPGGGGGQLILLLSFPIGWQRSWPLRGRSL